MSTFSVVIRTPEGTVVDMAATAMVVPGLRGRYGVLAHHAPMIGSVAPGILRLHAPDRQQWFVVGDGVLNVDANGVDVLVEHAVPAADPLDAEEKLEGYTKSLAQRPAVVTDVTES